MRILITGASGLVGSALARAYRDHEVFAPSHRELDITDVGALSFDPDLIFNCAVIGVDQCETNRALAEAVNVEGPRTLARLARTVHFSTNYVFDGESDRPYDVNDDARPVNVYGETKLAGERAVLQESPQSLVIRTSWVYGKGKDSFLATAADKLRRGERITAITDTFASTTYVEDLVARVRHMVDAGASGLHQVVNDGVCTYETFALECARLVGADPSLIDRVTESQMKRVAKRPRYTPMVCESKMRRWEEALASFAAETAAPH